MKMFCYLAENWNVGNDCTFGDVLYSKSFDWLMPVVQKINTYCDDIVALSTVWHTEYIRPLRLALLRADIAAIYEAVIRFIKWYNESKSV